MLGVSLNLVVGYTGLLSLTHAAFYGIGSYTTAILLTQSGVDFFPSVVLGIILTLIASFLIGLVLSKFRDDYYALGSFGFNAIAFAVFLNWQNLTRGPLGIPGISKPELFGIDFSNNFNFLMLVLAFIVFFFGRDHLHLPLAELQTLTFLLLVFTGQGNIYLVRERKHLWNSRPGNWLIISSVLDIIIVSILSIQGILMAAVSPLLVFGLNG